LLTINPSTCESALIKLRHQVHDFADHRELELQATPSAEIRYTTDGTNPREGRIYEGPVTVGDEKILLQVYAKAEEATGQSAFTIPEKGRQRAEIDDTKPARLVNQKVRLDTTDKVFALISTFKGRNGVSFQGVTLNVGEGEQAVTVRFNDRLVAPDMIGRVVDSLRENIGEPDALVQVSIRDGASFETGYDLKSFANLAGIDLPIDKVEQ
jgi:hypothetical protein